MKVLVISHMYPSIVNSTYGIFVHKQVKELINQGCQVKVICPVPYSPKFLGIFKSKWQKYVSTPKKDIYDGVEVYYPRYLNLPKGLFFAYSGYLVYLGIRETIKEISNNFDFELIHSHVLLPDAFSAIIANKKYKVPHVATVHGQDFQYTLNKSKRCFNYIMNVIDNVDRITVVSTKLKKLIDEKKYFNHIKVINNGIDFKDFILEDKEKKLNSNRIVSVSNLKNTKGIDLNIKAVSILKNKYSDIKYYIIGEGEEREYLENLTKELNLENNIEFCGKMDLNEVIKFLETPCIYSLPSWEEGFGVSYIEAMACGNPVIGVDGEGIVDVINNRENGLLVKGKDVNCLVKALDSLLADKEYAMRLGEAGKDTVMENFTWQKQAKNMKDLYEELIEGNFD